MIKIINIIKKDVRLYFNSPVSLVFFIVLPILFTVILSVATGGFEDTTVVLNYINQADSPLANSLLEILNEDDAIELKEIDLENARERYESGDLAVYMVIPADFNSDSLLKGALTVQLYQQPNRIVSQTIYQVLRLSLSKLTSAEAKLESVMRVYQRLHPEVDKAALDDLSQQLRSQIQLEIAQAPSRLVQSDSQTDDEIVYDAATSSSAGQLITWVFIPLVGLAGGMAYDRQLGTLKRLLATPTSRLTYFSATMLGNVLIALVQMSLLMIFGALVLKAPWLERPLPTFLLLFTFSLASAGLGAFQGSLVKTEGQASSLSTIIGMTFALLSGAWFPIELFPDVMQQTAKIFPTYWGMRGLKDILISNKPLEQILPTMGILLGFAALFLALGLIFFKTE